MAKPYDYTTAGFDTFLDRSIDSNSAVTLDSQPQAQSRQINYDQSQVSGSLGDILSIGGIQLDGQKRRITIYDENANESVWIGDIDE